MIKIITEIVERPREDGRGSDMHVEVKLDPTQWEPHVTSGEAEYAAWIKEATLAAVRDRATKYVENRRCAGFIERVFKVGEEPTTPNKEGEVTE